MKTSQSQPGCVPAATTSGAEPSAQFTPGPWKHVSATEHHGPFVVSDFGNTIADLYTMSRPSPWTDLEPRPVPFMHEMAEANAALIAAAPDLYEALKGLVEWYGKRTGVLGDDRLLPPDEQEPEVQKALAALTKAEGR